MVSTVVEIGRAGWFGIGVTGLALAGAVHAVTGAGRAAREFLHSPAGADGDPLSSGSDPWAGGGPGGWIVLGTLVLVGGVVYHLVAGTGTIVKQILHVAGK
jgi:hypothetical protein